MTPPHCVRSLTLPRPAAPPLYSPPSPIYHPDPTPSPAGANLVHTPLVDESSQGNCSGGSVIIDSGCPKPGKKVFKRQSMLTLRKVPKVSNSDDRKLWQQVQSELSKVLYGFCKDVTENIGTYDQLVDFAIRCDIPLTWLERAKENYPKDSQVVVNTVFYEWWDRCNLNIGKKIQMIQAAFGHIGKLAIFNRIMYMCPDLQILLEHATSNAMPPLTGGDGKTHTNKMLHVLEGVEALAQ